MTSITATTKQITDMLILREAGYTVLSISQITSFSVRTVYRHLNTHGIKKGSLKIELIENAGAEMLASVSSNSAIREHAARLVNDDLAHSNHIRNVIIEASEHLKATNVTEAALVMRAAAAYSTVIKNTSDTIRHSLGVDKIVDDIVDDLPELVVTELTNEQIKEMTKNRLVKSD